MGLIMAKLTAAKRNKLKTSTFAIPGERKYPVNDPNHARNALARVAQHGSPSEKARVRAKVHAKYPSIGKMHEGGTIPKSGMYEMEKGEKVTPAPKGMTGHWEINGSSKKWVAAGGDCSC